MMKKNHMLSWVLIIALLFTITACGKTSVEDQTTENIVEKKITEKVEAETTDGGGEQPPADEAIVLRLASPKDAGPLTPFKHMNRGPGIFKMQLIYDSLLERGPKEDIPWLAKSYESNDDQTVFTFHLEEHVKWHDGEDFSADDVVFTLDYFKEHPPIRNYLIDNGKYIIEAVEAVDKNTVKVEFIGFSPTYLHRLGITRIIPKHIWENVEEPMKYEGEGATVGCGPYVLTNYEPEKKAYRFEAFENYWGKKQVADILEYVPVSDAILALENGEIDISKVSPDMIDRFKGKDEFTIAEYHTHHSFRLYFNMEKRPELKEKSVRQAFAYGIDRESMMNKISRSYGRLTPMGYLIEEHPMYNPNIQNYSYDEEKAKALLNGKDMSFSLLVSNRPKEIKVAELMKKDLEKIGINVEINSVDFKSRDASVKKGDYELAIMYYGGMGADANMLKKYFYSYDGKKGGTTIGYSNPALDVVLDKQSKERDPEKRKQQIYEAQALIAEDVPMLLLFGDVEVCVYRTDKNDQWTSVYDHSKMYHPKLSFLIK